jgi:hypothetical protein
MCTDDADPQLLSIHSGFRGEDYFKLETRTVQGCTASRQWQQNTLVSAEPTPVETPIQPSIK